MIVQHHQSVETREGDSDVTPNRMESKEKNNYSENEVKWELIEAR